MPSTQRMHTLIPYDFSRIHKSLPAWHYPYKCHLIRECAHWYPTIFPGSLNLCLLGTTSTESTSYYIWNATLHHLLGVSTSCTLFIATPSALVYYLHYLHWYHIYHWSYWPVWFAKGISAPNPRSLFFLHARVIFLDYISFWVFTQFPSNSCLIDTRVLWPSLCWC